MHSTLLNSLSSPRHITTLALLAAVGIALFVIESFIPMPFPFLKIGLANVSSPPALMVFGVWEILLVVILRIVVGSFMIDSLFSPGFLLAIAGGTASAVVMAGAKAITRDLFSVVGISLIGSLTHMMTQFLLVLFLYVQNQAIVFLLPLLLFSALVGGLVVGWIASRLLGVVGRFQLGRTLSK